MKIIVLQEVESTSTLLKTCFRARHINTPLCIRAIHQTKGRGQRHTNWEVDSGKNLTFSFIIEKNMPSINGFVMSMLVSRAIYLFLQELGLPNLKIKWPNDILSGSKKIGGVLIEHLRRPSHKTSFWVVGIGLNVNQTVFENIPKASSLANICGRLFDIKQLLPPLLQLLEQTIERFSFNTDYQNLVNNYEHSLFRKDVVSTFKQATNAPFVGIIKGVTDQGTLKVLLADDSIVVFDLKEIQLLY